MTTIAEEKKRREDELKNASDMVVVMRLKVIEAIQLANEMKALTGQGLLNPYHEMAVFYGKQRALLRGLNTTDVMYFNLPDSSDWSQEPELTFPTTTRFGYLFTDSDGNPASIDDASLYYLTAKTDSRTLSTLEEDSNAFSAPVILRDQQQTMVAWGATQFSVILSQSPQPGTIKISLNNEQKGQDDGAGNIIGAGISGTIDYQNRAMDLSFTDPISQSGLLYAVYDSAADPVVQDRYERIDVTSHASDYQTTLGRKIIPGTLKILVADLVVAKDDGAGSISGENLIGTIDYETLRLRLNFTNPDDRLLSVSVRHDSVLDETSFFTTYSQINFTLGTRNYLPGHTLNLIEMAEGELEQRPLLSSTTLLRRKADHQVMGTLNIVCEGMERDPSWDYLAANAEDATLVNKETFNSLMGYLNLDLVNPASNNDLQNASNSYLSSSGRKVGEQDYPDIEKSPFWPCTDGEYVEAMVFKGNFVHWEEGSAKWSIHNDIKWRYGTRPKGYNPANYSTEGNTAQDNPNTVIAALQAIYNFAASGPYSIPSNSGSALSGGTDYQMVGGYVHRFPYVEDTPGSGNYVIGPGSEFDCYYNDVQHLVDNHLNHLLAQCNLLLVLGDNTNTIEPHKQPIDTQFVSDTTVYLDALQAFLTYHNGFEPLARSDYDSAQVGALKTATGPNGYLGQADSRLSYLDVVLGNPETIGSYSKTVYDACNYAANKEIGYLRDAIDQLNSIQDIYDMITKKQQQYAMYHEVYP